MIHVIVKTGSIIDEVTYPSVEDFVDDWLTWDILEDGLNTYYDPVDLHRRQRDEADPAGRTETGLHFGVTRRCV